MESARIEHRLDEDSRVEPTVLEGEDQGVELAAIVSSEPACPGHFRLDSVRDRNRKRDAVAGHRLKIAIINPIKNGVAAEVVRCVQRQPKTGPKIVADMRLSGPNRVLAPIMAAEKIRVVGIEPNACRTIDKPTANGLRETGLRFETPAIRTDVQDMLWVVITRRRPDREADTGCGRRLPLGELRWGERGPPNQVLGEAQLEVAQAFAGSLPAHVKNVTAKIASEVGKQDCAAGLLPEQVERAVVRDQATIGRPLEVFDGERRIKAITAGTPQIASEQKVGIDRAYRVGARFHVLGAGDAACADQAERRHAKEERDEADAPDEDHGAAPKASAEVSRNRMRLRLGR